MAKDDRTRLLHMLDAARTAVDSAKLRSKQDLRDDPVWAFGIVKLVEIIGEAASKVSPGVRADLPSIPWAAIVGMRNRLVHAYFEIDPDQVWKTVQEDLPTLAQQIEAFLDAQQG